MPACRDGADCTYKGCKFTHPTAEPKAEPKAMPACRNGADCTNKNCKFTHPPKAESKHEFTIGELIAACPALADAIVACPALADALAAARVAAEATRRANELVKRFSKTS
jgi:hypothetical protein